MELGPHAGTIGLCYAAVGIVLGALIAWLAADGHRLGRQLAGLEAQGIRRRSARPDAMPGPEPEPNSRT